MSNTSYYDKNLSLPRSQSYSTNSMRSFSNNNNINNYKRSESTSAISTLSSLSSSSSSLNGRNNYMNGNQSYMISPPPMHNNDYDRLPSSYYSSNVSDYDNSSRYQQPHQYSQQPLPVTPSSPTEYYGYQQQQVAVSPRLNASNNRNLMHTPSTNEGISINHNQDNRYDTRNTYADELVLENKIKPSISTNTKVSVSSSNSGKQYPIFPPTDEMRLKINTNLLATEDSFKVIYAGDAFYKPDKGLLTKTKRTHFVLTNNHLLIYKSAQKARSEINMFDIGANQNNKAVDKDRIFLKLSSISGVHAAATPGTFTFRIEYFHPQSNQALSHSITVDTDKELKQWMQALRKAVWVHHPRIESISSTERFNVIDRLAKQSDGFANSDHVKIYKVVFKEKRFKVGNDAPKEVFLPVILAIGKFSFYFLPITLLDDEYLKTVERDRFGLLSIQNIKYEDNDDTVVIEVKQVSKNNRQLVFASTFCEEIVQYMMRSIDSLIPSGQQTAPLYTLNVPPHIKHAQIIPFTVSAEHEDELTSRDDEETIRFNVILRAFTAAMNLNKSRFHYTIAGPMKAKVFTLLPPNEVGGSPPTYQKYELLAIFRTIQANNIFVDISFANLPLDEIETWSIQAKHGWTANSALKDENVLSNEIYNILTNLKALRKLDLSNCSIGKASPDHPMRRQSALSIIGVVMKAGKTHVSRLSLGKNKMFEADLTKLIQGIKEHKKSIKELYLNECGLEKDMIELVLKTLYEKNPEQVIRLDLSTDVAQGMAIDPELVQRLIPTFKRLETLRMRGYNLVSMNYDFLLEQSHLHELDLGGSRMNDDIVARLCKWIQTPSFQTIEELSLGDCNLNGKNVYDILQSISQSGNRAMHLNLERNPIMKEVMHLPKLHSAILLGEGPKSVSFARIEWDDSTLREFIDCLRDNQTISHIDLSDITMRDTDEISEDTVRMLTSLFERNTVINELELNFNYNKASHSPFTRFQPKSLVCQAIVQALNGLRHNRALQHIDLSGLNFEDAGAMALSRVLKSNRTLQSIVLDDNNISIDGYRNLTKVIEENASQIINVPIPRNDVRNQLRYLVFRIEELIITENEAQFFLIHTTASDKKKAKKHEMEMVVQERRTSELALKNLEHAINALMVVVRKNLREHEDQNYRNMEIQLQAQTAAQELAIAQVRLQQSRAPSALSGTNLSAVGGVPTPPIRTRNVSSSNASTTSSSNSSIHNLCRNASNSRRSMMSTDYAGSMISSPIQYSHSYYHQNMSDPRMYMSRSNNIEEEMILGKPHSYEPGNNILQSPVTPQMEYPESFYRPSGTEYSVDSTLPSMHHQYHQQPYQQQTAASVSQTYSLDDPGFVSDFGYVEDFEQSFLHTGYMMTPPPQQKAGQNSHRDSAWNEDQLIDKMNRGLYLPPDAKD